MPDPDFAHLASQHTLDALEIPRIATELAGNDEPQLVWQDAVLVGARGFEPPTPWPPAKCAARLRHAPTEAPV